MADIIQADYEQLEQIAQRFQQHAEQNQQLLQMLQTTFHAVLDEGWEGHGRVAFEKEMRDIILPTQQRLVDALN